MAPESFRYRLRPASKLDEPAIAQLYFQGWHEAHAEIVPSALLPDRTVTTFKAKVPGILEQCIVAENDIGPIGFLAWKGPELGQLFIDPNLQGRGLASALLAAGETQMAESGVSEAFLTCVIGNARARSFYIRHAWLQAGEEDYPAKVGGEIVPVPVWRMTKQLRR